jgi:hypothetical protein
MERASVERLVRRARARLEAARIVRAAARGALGLGAVALAAELLGKAWAPARGPDALPWLLLGAGALAGAAAAAARGRVGLADAALLLDRRLGTEERIVTVLTRGKDEFTDRAAAELAPARLPRIPLPREAGLVPAALFLLFAAGLLPEAVASPGVPAPRARPAQGAPTGAAAVPRPEEPPPDAAAAVERLAAGSAPAPEDVEPLREAIRRGLHTPEERARAAEALDRAKGGDAAAAREVARALSGRGGVVAPAPPPESPGAAPGGVGGAAVAYPEEEEFLLAYRRALRLSEERR